MPPPERPKKERVIHTRVPELLDDEIRRHATDLGLSVSYLVRSILQNTFGLVEDIVQDSAAIARSARGEPAPRRRAGAVTPPRVLGWNLAVLNVNAVCGTCNAILARGVRAGIGVLDGPGATPFRCLDCLKELTDADDGSSTAG